MDGHTSGALRRGSLTEATADAMTELIRRNGLAVGGTMPTISELSRQLRVSRTLVRAAVEQLGARGVVVRTSGRRWTVARRPGERPPSRHRTTGSRSAVQYRSLADQASAAILRMIVDERYAIGDPLPSTRELAERLGVSIVVVREALASLAARGILHKRQGRESVVAAPSFDIISSILEVRARLDGIAFDDFQQCREVLETLAAGLAATRVPTPEERATLEQLLGRMRDAPGPDEFNQHDLALHMEVARLSGNQGLALMLRALNHLIRSNMDMTYRDLYLRGGRRGVRMSHEAHERIVAAVIAGDREAAETAVHDHFSLSDRI